MEIILLAGKAGVGKDTYAKKISHEFSRTVAFADLIKKVAKLLTWNGEKDDKGRRLLQELGDVSRRYNENVFVDTLIDYIKHLFTYGVETIIVTDTRYDNEVKSIFEAFYKRNGIKVSLIELIREFDSSLSEDNQKHSSEQGISEEIKNLDGLEYIRKVL